ncbi:MAG: DUF5916 domain-containing protein [Acidobacteriota bacterium]|nr:DUF5916 domain-containing protein [Acidobacteriota bacterium]
MHHRLFTLLGLLLLVAGPASAQEEHEHDQELNVPLVEEVPVADGRLDEEVWALAAVADGFIQTEPVDGAEPTYATEVYVAYTRDALLVGARMEDDDPAAIVAREYRRDANLESDDNFFIVLDTYHDHRSAVFFSTNAVGTRQDGLVQNEGAAINNEWDGVWRVGSRRTEDGWTTEMVIPFETLRFPRGTRNFGVNFGRQVARTREISFWAPISVDWGFNAMWRVSAYGVMHGMEHANPGGRIKLKPFGVAGITGEGEERDGTTDLGLDAKVSLGSNLNLDVTLNTDFAQVEADEQQVNLTRFELFFPEQREFFLENAGLFQVGETTRPFEPPEMFLFFSRRIGLSDDGEIIPIVGGARVTGKLGATDVGAFHIRQQAFEGVSPTTGFTALRLRRDVLQRSAIGVMALDRTEIGGDSHRVGAADFSWAPNESATITGYAARSATPGVEGRESAFGVTGQVGDDRWNLFTTYNDIGEGFRSELGFVPRTGIRKVRVEGLWSPRIGRYGIRQIFVGPGLIRITEPDGSIQTQNVGFGPFFLFDDGSQFFVQFSRNTEGLSESFELRDGVEINEGQYTTSDLMTMVNTSQSRRVSFNLFAMNNGFFDGRLRVYSPGLAVRPHPRVRLQVNYSRSEVRLPQENGDFNTNLVVLRGLVALSPDAFIRGLLQWNDDDGNFSGNVQLRWNYRPGSDIYVVYNERQPFGMDSDEPSYRELLAKLTWYWVPG